MDDKCENKETTVFTSAVTKISKWLFIYEFLVFFRYLKRMFQHAFV